jgi:hypothetical protein
MLKIEGNVVQMGLVLYTLPCTAHIPYSTGPFLIVRHFEPCDGK